MKQVTNKYALMLASLAILTSATIALPTYAENVTQTIEMVKIDVQKLSTGYRTSKIIGSNIMSDTDETIGKVDDLIVSPDDNKTAYVILSVGGWLGMGTHLVAIPYSMLRVTTSKIVLPGATKEGLKGLPEFKYSTT